MTEKIVSKKDNLQILHEDNHIIVINKRVGDIVQGDKTGDKPLSEIVKEYIKDKYSLPRSMYSVKSVDGDSVEERRQNFLNLYGVGVYRQSAFWVDASA